MHGGVAIAPRKVIIKLLTDDRDPVTVLKCGSSWRLDYLLA